jgi:methylthioribulose-1-phosphate dehydratase
VGDPLSFVETATRLADLARQAYARGWVLGTSGNFSAVLTTDPPELAITATGLDKRALRSDQVLRIDARGNTLEGNGRPSAEASLHLVIVRVRGAGAVAHTHSPSSTLLSELQAESGGVALEGYEMLKGLSGVQTHEHREWLPIIQNTQDWAKATSQVESVLNEHPSSHGFLIRKHGLYTWGRDLAETQRHLEVLEYLLDVVGRLASKPGPMEEGDSWPQ